MQAAHSTWSASGFEQKMLCPGSHVLQAGLPNKSSAYAAEGTAAHQVLTWALQNDNPASTYVGAVIHLDANGKPCEPCEGLLNAGAEFTIVVDDEMAAHVQTTIDYCRALQGDDGVLFADIRVNYSSYLDVPEAEAWGTADVIIARGDEIVVVDFKYGQGVEVSAERNPQMSLYALGALQSYQGLVGDFTRVRMAISQPRVRQAPSEYDLTVGELELWGRGAARSAVISCINAADGTASDTGASEWESVFLHPGEKQCKFCRAKATCPALRNEVANTVSPAPAPASADEFASMPLLDETDIRARQTGDADWLAACLSKADLIEDWCKAVRAEVERRLLAGESVPGFKVVQGKRGSRKWADPKAAEELLRKTFRLPVEEAYDLSLISPTSAEKLHKAGKIGPRQWPKAVELITQSEGKPHVAPANDPRPALDIRPVVEDFTDVTAESEFA
jgi:hypothetical protein